MAEAITYQCPNCNGRLMFDGASGKLTCEFCNSAFDPTEIEELYAAKQAAADGRVSSGGQSSSAQDFAPPAGEPVIAGVAPVQQTAAEASLVMEEPQVRKAEPEEDPIQTYIKNAKWENLDEENLHAFNCSSCGAQLLVDAVTAVTHCPYCGNATVVPGQLADVLKPDYVIPFKYDKNAAIAALKAYYSDKKLLPNSFSNQNHIEEIQGIYVPFWLYSGHVQAQLNTTAENVRVWMDSKNQYTATDHFNVFREGEMEFHHIPVDGSTKMPDAHMDSIEPFDYSEMVPFSVGYLPGYLADRYDQDVADCRDRAHVRMESTCGSALKESITGYNTVNDAPAHTNMSLSDIAYALLPVWMLHTRWNNEDFLFAMNGQTGKLIGDLPIDKGKVVKTFCLWYFPLAIILAVIVYFTLGFGF